MTEYPACWLTGTETACSVTQGGKYIRKGRRASHTLAGPRKGLPPQARALPSPHTLSLASPPYKYSASALSITAIVQVHEVAGMTEHNFNLVSCCVWKALC